MFYLKLSTPFSGLSNQVFSLVNSIILAFSTDDKVVCIDHFSTDFRKPNNYANITNILNIKKINNFLHSKYGIIIIDKNEPCNLKMNYISYDPRFNTRRLKMNYTVGDYTINEIYSGDIDIKNAKYVNMPSFWIDSYDRNMFEDILQNIEFNDQFISQSRDIVSAFDGSCVKINVIHLRVEDDAIEHWSKMNELSEMDFKNFIESKYISLIKRYLAITDFTIILTDSKQNSVFEFLKQSNYKFTTVEKLYEDRELNAIIDLLVSSACNSTFIGNFIFDGLNGSTFSYLISKRFNTCATSANTNIRQIMIDLDRIFEPEQIF